MKFIYSFENYTSVEYVSRERDTPSYKNDVRKRKKRKKGELSTLDVIPNKVKDIISFKQKY
jgi:hypothetical protein